MGEQGGSATTTLVTFKLGKETFALEISRVREVLDFSDVTQVPQTPAFMLGIINLRGNVVPVVDLRRKLNLQDVERTRDTRVLILEILVDHERVTLGAVADCVREVIELEAGQVSPPPGIGTLVRADFMKSMGRKDGEFIMILDVDKVFSLDDIAAVQAADPAITTVDSVDANRGTINHRSG